MGLWLNLKSGHSQLDSRANYTRGDQSRWSTKDAFTWYTQWSRWPTTEASSVKYQSHCVVWMMQNTPTDKLELSCYGALAKEESETKCDIVSQNCAFDALVCHSFHLVNFISPFVCIWVDSHESILTSDPSQRDEGFLFPDHVTWTWFLLGSRIISPRALDPRTLGPRTLDPRHPKSQGPVILGPMVLRTISPGILGPWKPWPLGPKVLWLKVLGPMVQGT